MAVPQIILIPGLLNDAELWRDQIADLATVASPVVADITKGSNLSDLVDAVLDVAEETFAIAGFSLGGVVAQEVLKRVPERVTHLGLLDTTMLPDSSERLHDRARLIAMATEPPGHQQPPYALASAFPVLLCGVTEVFYCCGFVVVEDP